MRVEPLQSRNAGESAVSCYFDLPHCQWLKKKICNMMSG